MGESHGQDRKHKEEITIFKNPAENQQRNKENNILEVLGQALRKQKNLQKTKNNNISELFLESPQIPRPGKNQKKTKEPKNTIFQNSFLSHPKFQDLEKTKKTKRTKRTKKNIFQNSFLSHPKFQDLEKTKKTKRNKKANISELFLETPQIPRPLENCFFFVFFFCFFWFSAGFCQEA